MSVLVVKDSKIQEVELDFKNESDIVDFLDGYQMETKLSKSKGRQIIVLHNDFVIGTTGFTLFEFQGNKRTVKGDLIVLCKDIILGTTNLTSQEKNEVIKMMKIYKVGSQ